MFPDNYHYLIGKDGWDKDWLRSYESLEDFRLFVGGHVEDVKNRPDTAIFLVQNKTNWQV